MNPRFRFLFLLMIALPAAALPRGEFARARQERLKQQVDHAQHREMRIREALERGDITQSEADALRERRREARRQRLERWQAQQQGEGKPPAESGEPAAP
jgi:hypothetical protein